MSMVSLGLVMLVSSRTGSYSLAGAVSASFVAANAVVALPLARIVDRAGQGRVLGLAMTASMLWLGLAVISVELDWPLPLPHLLAALSGASMPNIGAAVRARWSHVVDERPLLDTAFAVEAVNDEVVFIVGPTLLAFLAAALDPVAGLATAAVAALVGTWALVAQRSTEPPLVRRSRDERLDPMPWRALAPLVGGGVSLGVVLGGCEVATIALADERDHPTAAGLLLAVWALGSLISGVVSGAVVQKRDPATRYRIGSIALAVLLLPLPFVTGLVALGAFLFLCGFAISPTLIAAVSWVESTVPGSRLNEGIAAFTTGLVAGVAPGAALVGAVVDRAGASASFWVPIAAGAAGVLLAVTTSATRRREALGSSTR
jgi:MFS family permease